LGETCRAALGQGTAVNASLMRTAQRHVRKDIGPSCPWAECGIADPLGFCPN
jgi:hypothetical protein